MMDLKDKTVLITGATRGCGWEIAQKLSGSGCRIIVNFAHNSGDARNALRYLNELGADAEIQRADVSDQEDTEAMFQNLAECFGNVDVLIHCARISPPKRTAGENEDEWFDRVFSVTVKGAMLCTQSFLRNFRSGAEGMVLYLLRSDTKDFVTSFAEDCLKQLAEKFTASTTDKPIRFLAADTNHLTEEFSENP